MLDDMPEAAPYSDDSDKFYVDEFGERIMNPASDEALADEAALEEDAMDDSATLEVDDLTVEEGGETFHETLVKDADTGEMLADEVSLEED